VKLTKLRVRNYRGLREVDLPLSEFACVIGENNSGNIVPPFVKTNFRDL
jgi:putative ATP-dependent endonuclease of the OLD family